VTVYWSTIIVTLYVTITVTLKTIDVKC